MPLKNQRKRELQRVALPGSHLDTHQGSLGRLEFWHNMPQPASSSPEITHEPQDEASSDKSDDTIMREIDEVVLALAKEANEESSSAAVVLPQGSKEGVIPSSQGLRSPPPSFKDFVEEEVIATPMERVKDPLVSQRPLKSSSVCELSPGSQPGTVPSKHKGKEVVSERVGDPPQKKASHRS